MRETECLQPPRLSWGSFPSSVLPKILTQKRKKPRDLSRPRFWLQNFPLTQSDLVCMGLFGKLFAVVKGRLTAGLRALDAMETRQFSGGRKKIPVHQLLDRKEKKRAFIKISLTIVRILV